MLWDFFRDESLFLSYLRPSGVSFTVYTFERKEGTSALNTNFDWAFRVLKSFHFYLFKKNQFILGNSPPTRLKAYSVELRVNRLERKARYVGKVQKLEGRFYTLWGISEGFWARGQHHLSLRFLLALKYHEFCYFMVTNSWRQRSFGKIMFINCLACIVLDVSIVISPILYLRERREILLVYLIDEKVGLRVCSNLSTVTQAAHSKGRIWMKVFLAPK